MTEASGFTKNVIVCLWQLETLRIAWGKLQLTRTKTGASLSTLGTAICACQAQYCNSKTAQLKAENSTLTAFRVCIHNTSFSSELNNNQNKLECYSKLHWKGLHGTNTRANWAHL
jgi:hypothetical protein